jgi:predicted HTH domain antitoxin
MKRTNIMLSEDQHRRLTIYARKNGRTLGELVRNAIDAVYNEKEPLEHRRKIALDSYREGLISLGKVAEILGLDPVSARSYLKKQGIPIQAQGMMEIREDALNA